MTVKKMFIVMLKIILKGKGDYRIFVQEDGWIGGVFNINKEDDKMKRIVIW